MKTDYPSYGYEAILGTEILASKVNIYPTEKVAREQAKEAATAVLAKRGKSYMQPLIRINITSNILQEPEMV